MDSKQLEKRKKVLLDLMNDKIYVPMKIKELAIILQVSKEERPDLELVLNELLAEGKIEISKRGKYKIAKEKKELRQKELLSDIRKALALLKWKAEMMIFMFQKKTSAMLFTEMWFRRL